MNDPDVSRYERLEQRLENLERQLREVEDTARERTSKHGTQLAAVETQVRLMQEQLSKLDRQAFDLLDTAAETKGTVQQIAAGHLALRRTLDDLLLQLARSGPRPASRASVASPGEIPGKPPN